ncbi:MAG: CBS domain-containing protein [Methanosarcinaceae archaeon]|nr:CBS domain-containing protein [Methanosarcinaceae archaeon]
MSKTIAEINEKIKRGDACVVTAEEMPDIVDRIGLGRAAREVDVVTTGTFGAMCSSGAFLNFGHSEIPIRMAKTYLNKVEAYSGVAAVDAYIGATQLARDNTVDDIRYGGANVIEDLICGRTIELKAESYGTDCYPLKEITTNITIDDLNQAVMVNPRNAYQRYDSATNGSNKIIHTYMGELLPDYRNVTYSGAGILSPLSNDPEYRSIGIGTRIFIGGAQGYVIGPGTQCSSASGFGTLMTMGDMKKMNPEYVNAAAFTGYGTSLYLGIGIPIPILDENMAKATSVRDSDITVSIKDYSVKNRDRPVVKTVSYAELKSGFVEIYNHSVPTSPLSSFKRARKVASELKRWILEGDFILGTPVETIPQNLSAKPMKETMKIPLVGDIMDKFPITIEKTGSVVEAARKMRESSKNHIPVVFGPKNHLEGIITSWDVSKAVSEGTLNSVEKCMTKKVIYCYPDEKIDVAASRLSSAGISAMPVVDSEGNVVGLITSEDFSKLFSGRKLQ